MNGKDNKWKKEFGILYAFQDEDNETDRNMHNKYPIPFLFSWDRQT